MTLRQVQERLQLSRTMLYRLMRQRRLVPVHIGKAVRFEAAAVDAFIESLAEQQQIPEDPWELLRERRRQH
jgi:excisionase family DNA binding protein